MRTLKITLHLIIQLFIFNFNLSAQHNGTPEASVELNLQFLFYNGEKQMFDDGASDINDKIKFCVVGISSKGEENSFGTMKPDGTPTPFYGLEEWSSALYVDELDPETGKGAVIIDLNTLDLSKFTATYDLKIIFYKVSTGESVTIEYFADDDQESWEVIGDVYFAPEEDPSNKPTLRVDPIIAGCWVDGGTFDLTAAFVSKSPESAEVKYYEKRTDAENGTNAIDATKVSMKKNPDLSPEIRKYYAVAVEGEDKSDIQEIEVTFYQKPDVTLSVDKSSPICYDEPITLTTLGKFTPGTYHYYSSEAALDEDGPASLTGKKAVKSTRYYVYVNSAKNCKDTAHVDVTVIPTIAAGDIQITASKTVICDGESVDLTVSYTGSYAGQIDYKWGNMVAAADRSKTTITVTPSATTTYTVGANANGCSSTGTKSQIITVNPTPKLSITPDNPSVCSGKGMDLTANMDLTGTYVWKKDGNQVGTTNTLSTGNLTATTSYEVVGTSAAGCKSSPQTITVDVNPSPTPKILVNGAAPDGSQICAGTEITLSCDNTGYSTYTWTGGTATTNDYERKATIVAGNNTFDLSVTDGHGCTGTATTVAISGKAAPTVTIDPVAAACAGSDVTLTARPNWVGGSGTVAWTGNGVANASAEATTATLSGQKNTYTVTVTDQNHCTATASMDVVGNELTLSTMTVSPTSLKAGNPVSLSILASWNGVALAASDATATYVWKKTVSGTETNLASTSNAATDTPDANTTYTVTVTKEGCEATQTGNVTVLTDPFNVSAIAAVGNWTGVCEGEDLSASPLKCYVTVSGGQKNYTYAWTVPSGMTVESTNTDTLKITAIDYTTFLGGTSDVISVTVSDASTPANTSTKTMTFQVRQLPQIAVNGVGDGGTISGCKDASLTLTAVATGATFSWSTGATGASISASTGTTGTTTYMVTATYGGCSSDATVSVTVNDLPDLALTATQGGNAVTDVCPGSVITLNATVTGESNPTLTWGKGANGLTGTNPDATVTGPNPTLYEVSYTDATTGCTAVKNVTVGIYPTVNLAIAVSPSSTVCAGSEVTLTASNGASYQWSVGGADLTGETNATLVVHPTTGTTYTANGKDSHGCDATPISTTITVTPAPTLALSKTKLDGCAGLTVDLANAVDWGNSTSGPALRVKNGGGNLVPGTTVTTDGTYTLYLDGGSCPSNEETVTVTFHALPNVNFVADKSEVCSGGTITLTANSSDNGLIFTYGGTNNTTWTDAPANTGSSSITKTYTVTARDGYGCTNTADATVTVKPLPTIQITDPGSICENSEVTLTASGADTYVWSGGPSSGSGPTYTVRPSGSNNQFSVIGTKDGCDNTADITLSVLPAPVLADARDLEACVGEQLDLSTAFTTEYTLEFYDSGKNALLSSDVTVTTDATYYATATVGTCSTDFKAIAVTAKALPSVSILGIDEVCAGTETTLTANGTGVSSYTWNPGTADEQPGTTLTVTPTVTTTYTVRAIGNNNCTADATLTMKVNPLPELVADAGNPKSLVAGSTGVFNVALKSPTTPTYAYEWKHNDAVDGGYTSTNYRLTGTVNPEKLSVTVTDGKGCTSNPLDITIPVTPQGGELAVTLTAEGSNEICQGGVQVLTATLAGGKAPYHFVWYKDGTDMGVADDIASITVSDAATYRVEVTDEGTTPQTKDANVTLTMSATRTAPTVVVPDLTIPTGNRTLLLAEVTPATGSYTYKWEKVADLKDAGQATLAVPETRILTGDTPYEVLVKDANGCYAKATGTVRVDDAHGFKVLASADISTTCIGNSVQLNATLQGNIPADPVYEWMPTDGLSATNVADPTFVSTAAGTREFVVKVSKDGYVAVGKVSVEVQNRTAPILQLTPSGDVACLEQRITASAQGGSVTNWQWEIDGRAPIAGGTYIDTLAAGNRHVKVTATATNGCPVTPAEMDYTIHELPTIDWAPGTPDRVDKGSALTVTAIADGGATGDYTYDWTGTSGGTASGNAYTVAAMNNTKTFKVKVTNNVTTCSSKEISKSIGVQAPTPNVEIEVRAEQVSLCVNGVGLLEVTHVKGGSGTEDDFTTYSYVWKQAGSETVLSTEASCVATAAGTYTVTVTEPKTGKSAEKSVTVTTSGMEAPQVADATQTVLMNTQAYLFAAVSGGTPDYTYNWNPTSALATSNTRENPTTTALSAPQTYICYVTDANGCTGQGTIQVNVVESSDPQWFALSATADNANPCVGNTVHLTARPSRTLNNPTYEWTPATGLSADNLSNPTLTTTQSGMVIYTVKATEQDGYSVTAQVAVTVKSTEAPQLELADAAGDCAGEKLTVSNRNGAVIVNTYHWVIDGVPDNSVTGAEYALGAGDNQEVKVYANAQNGCTSDTVSGVFSRKPVPTIAWNLQPTTATEGDDFTVSVTAEPGVTYKWHCTYPDGTSDEGPDDAAFDVTLADKGTYVFTVKVEKDGCESEELSHTVTVLERGAGLVVTTDVTSKQICENGSAIVTATGHNGSGTYTYRWFAGTTVSGTPVATGATAILSPTVNGQRYVVEVNDGTNTAVSSPITLTFNSNFAPMVTGGTQQVAAGHATILLSTVTMGTADAYHWSSSNDQLVSGEETKAYPKTKPLSADETFTYYVTDANGCISKPADVRVEVDAAADALAIEVQADMTDLCRGNTTRLNVVATQGTLSAAALYEWMPTTYLTDVNTGHPTFTATVAGNYSYLVKVSDQGKVLVAGVDLTVKGYDAPEFAWVSGNPTSYELNGSFIMKTEVTTPTKGAYTYHWFKPTDFPNEPTGQWSVATASESSYDFAVVMTDGNGCRTTDTLTAHLEADGGGGDRIAIDAADVNACAVAAGESGTATLTVTKTAGPADVVYAWSAVGNTLPLSNANTANATVNIAGAAAGVYTFSVTVTNANDNTNRAEKNNVKLTINESPTSRLAEDCFALYKDSTIMLTIVNEGEYDYLWRESVYGTDWSTPTEKGSKTTCEVKMGDQNMRYILMAVDPENGCSVNDTAMIYRIPDAPKIGIDTNTNRLNVKLDWSAVAGNDGYTVWSRKWDPYCMTAADGGVYAEETRTTSTTWAETAMDTLEFYYVTADRNVCGTTYHSQTSDTVGYYLMDVKYRGGETSSFDWYPLYFDMTSSGLVTTEDFLRWNIDVLSSVTKWEYADQTWCAATTFYNPKDDDPESTDPIEFFDVFDLPYGSVIRVEATKDGKLLQFGKLPKPITFKLEGANTDAGSRFTLSFIQPWRADLRESRDVLIDLKERVSTIVSWNPETQVLNTATSFYNPKDDDPESTDPIEYFDEFKLRILLPVRLDNSTNVDIDWR